MLSTTLLEKGRLPVSEAIQIQVKLKLGNRDPIRVSPRYLLGPEESMAPGIERDRDVVRDASVAERVGLLRQGGRCHEHREQEHDMVLSEQVTICEVGPRDGFQFEQKLIPTDLKVEIIQDLLSSGLQRIQVTSFVHPTRVPQMADAEEICRRIQPPDGVVLSGLILNRKGLDRARTAGLRAVDMSIATHEQHCRDNTGMSLDEAEAEAEDVVAAAVDAGLEVQLGLQTVFGYRQSGDIPLEQVLRLARRFAEAGAHSLSLADSTGFANPVSIRERILALQELNLNVPLVLHLHDTRGLALANAYEALACGVSWFDASLGGLGGCPFIPGATGNVATEDLVWLFESTGVSTGIDPSRVAACSRRMESFLEHPLPGKLMHLV